MTFCLNEKQLIKILLISVAKSNTQSVPSLSTLLLGEKLRKNVPANMRTLQ